jgi:hypothetical protein
MTEKLLSGIAGALAGAILSWLTVGLQLTGRVSALEVGMTRMEQKIDRIGERIKP